MSSRNNIVGKPLLQKKERWKTIGWGETWWTPKCGTLDANVQRNRRSRIFTINEISETLMYWETEDPESSWQMKILIFTDAGNKKARIDDLKGRNSKNTWMWNSGLQRTADLESSWETEDLESARETEESSRETEDPESSWRFSETEGLEPAW